MNVLILIILCCVTTAVHALINPILPGWNPDPSLLRVGDDFFIATSTFEYFPGVPIYHSRNLVDWTLIGHALNRPSQLALFGTPSDAGIWAPSLRYYNGTFYLATTTRYVYSPELRLFPRSFYVSTTDIFSNEWSDPVYFDHLGYDADLFWDTNGDVYATWAGIDNAQDKIYGIYQSQIDIDTGNSLTPAELIFTGTLENNSSARPEGPHIYLVNGTYYLLIAEGGTGESHRATVQRGPSPSGPWENNPANPILYNGRDSKNVLQATGHADFAEGPDGRWWGSALAVVPQNGNFSHQQLGRQTILFPVTWESGWPVFNGGESVTPHMADVLSDVSPLTIYFNDFISLTNQSSKTSLKSLDPPGSEIVLDDSFYTIRTPQKPFYSLAAREGHLRVYGNGFKVGDRDTPALLLRKQAAYTEEFEVVLDDFKPRSSSTGGVGTENGGREEAGATILYSDFLHDDIGVTSANGTGVDGKRAIVTRTIVQAKQAGPWALGSENNTVINVRVLLCYF
ncbi:glycosyl hydrolase [Moniliophthora roreri MCA 2997]|uniref:Glycosyl hydrolase n=1 Tax=Moniliophthora roreri (strain MCA 2997) TaxID=1381753 RepID=V2XFU0_MONRO|nr:glycosyl hydrolase [Moniliophthora roreri MCA 2997]